MFVLTYKGRRGLHQVNDDMKIDSVHALVKVLGASKVLEPPQLEEVVRGLQPRFQDPRALAKELMQRGWLTSYHVNQLFQGQTPHLVLGSYVLLERIGEGGMGQVFKARHQKLGRVVALKIIRKEWMSNPEAVRRFQREIKAAAQLQHPNIVHAFDADHTGDHHFIAMEYVEGIDLAKLIKQSGPLPAPIACDYVRQAALGLQHAHEKGMVHRDIKPSNLLVTRVSAQGSDSGTKGRWGQVKILDMGVALIPRPEQDDQGGTLTQAGAVVGTPDYMAPEQARDSRGVDIRADLYSLGCALYQILAGQVPFPGGTGMEKVFKHQLEEPRPLEQVRPDLPRGLGKIVRKLMAKRPEERYSIPGDAAIALDPFTKPGKTGVVVPTILKNIAPTETNPTSSSPDTARPQTFRPTRAIQEDVTPAYGPALAQGQPTPAPAWRRWKLWLIAPVAAVLVLAILTIALWPRGKNPSAAKGPPSTTKEEPVNSPLDRLQRAQFPAADRPDKLPPEVVAVLGEPRLKHWGNIMAIAHSPDSRRIATLGLDKAIRIWDAMTGDQVRAIPIPTTMGGSLAFTSDGKGIVGASGNQGFSIWDIATGSLRVSHSLADHSPLFLVLSPDGQTALVSSGKDKSIHVVDVADGRSRQVIPSPGPNWRSASFAPNGSTAALFAANYMGGPGQVIVWDLKAGKERHRFQPKDVPFTVTMAPDGDTVALADARGIHFFNAAKGQITRTRPSARASSNVWFSPKGTAVLLAEMDKTGLLDFVTGEEKKTLPKEIGRITVAAFSPDGRTATLCGMGHRLIVWDLATGRERFAPSSGQPQDVPLRLAFTADEQALISAGSFPAPEVIRWEIGKQPARQAQPVGEGAWLVGMTPDLKSLVFRTQNGLVVRDAATGQEKGRLSQPANQPIWLAILSPGGTRIAIRTGNEAPVRLLDVPSLTQSATLTQANGPQTMVAFSGDDRTLVTADARGRVKLWDAITGQERTARIPEYKGPVSWIAANTNAGTIALVDGDRVVHLLDTVTGTERGAQQVASVPHLRGGFINLRFSPDGKTLVVWTGQGFQLWETATGKVKAKLTWGEFTRFGPTEFSPDSRVMAHADQEGRVTLWDTADGREVFHRQLPGGVTSLAFAQGHRYLATGNRNGTVCIFRLP